MLRRCGEGHEKVGATLKPLRDPVAAHAAHAHSLGQAEAAFAKHGATRAKVHACRLAHEPVTRGDQFRDRRVEHGCLPAQLKGEGPVRRRRIVILIHIAGLGLARRAALQTVRGDRADLNLIEHFETNRHPRLDFGRQAKAGNAPVGGCVSGCCRRVGGAFRRPCQDPLKNDIRNGTAAQFEYDSRTRQDGSPQLVAVGSEHPYALVDTEGNLRG